MQGWIDLLDVVHDVTLRDKQILPSIVVEVLEPHAPSGTRRRQHAQARLQTAIAERAVAVIVVNGVNLFGQVRHDDVGLSVIIVIAEIDAHSGKGVAVIR